MEKRFSRRKRRRRIYGLNRRQKKAVNQIVKKKLETIPEKKYLDEIYDSVAVSVACDNRDVTQPGVGDGASNRQGLQIELQSISYRLTFTVSDTTNIFRFIIAQIFDDNIDYAADYPLSAILHQVPVNTITTIYQIDSPYAIIERQHSFKVLMDKHLMLSADTPQITLEGFINKGFRKRLTYDTSTDFGSNHIYCFIVSDSTTVSHPEVYGHVRIRYTDL